MSVKQSATSYLPLERVDSGYQGDRFGAKALISNRGTVLLIKERRSDGTTFWTLPGGGVRATETFPEALRRELTEELRSQSTVGPAVGACMYEHSTSYPTSTVYLVFECELDDRPKPHRAEGVIDLAWVPPTDLPKGVLGSFRHFLNSKTIHQVLENNQ